MKIPKKTLLVLSVLLGVFAGGVMIGAAPNFQIVQAVKDTKMKIIKDGRNVSLKAEDGRPLYPLLYEGVTYLPVRTIGEEMGLDASFDEVARVVHLNTKKPEGDLRLVDYKGRSGGNVLFSLVDKDLNIADTDFSHGAIVKGNTKLSFTFPQGTYRSFESDIVVLRDDPNSKGKKSNSKKNITIRAFEVVDGKEIAFFTDTFKPMKTTSEGERLTIRIDGKKEIRIAIEGADGYTKVIFGNAVFRK